MSTVPLKNPQPNIQRFLDAILGRKVPEKVPMVEYLIDNVVMQPILEETLGRTWVQPSDKDEYMGGQMELSKEGRASTQAFLDNVIAFWYHMGYDFVRVEVSLPLPAVSHVTHDTAEGHQDLNRAWQGMTQGTINTWEDFEKYPWPEINDNCFFIHEHICGQLPDGLGFITCHAGGVYEHVSRLLGYEGLCLMLHDNPELLKAVTDKLGELIEEYNRRLLQFEGVAVIFQGEDLGFNTQTLIPPDDIRQYFLPWHKKYAQMCHDAGRPYFLHSCGEVTSIMDDLIDDVKIDAKHSFQDNIMPVAQWKERYGDRIAMLGGVDVDKLTSYEPAQVRKYVREIIEQCAPGGRFAIGSGNSIPSYIPPENYLAMVEEALA